MTDKNRNMDNQPTIYVPENDYTPVPPANLGIPPQTSPNNNMYGTRPGVSPQSPQNNNFYGARPGVSPHSPQNNNFYGTRPDVSPQSPQNNNIYGARPGVSPQSPQNNNFYGARPGVPPQSPKNNNFYGSQPGIPPQAPFNNMYGAPPAYGAPPSGYKPPKKNGNGAVIAMIVMIVVLILAIIGISLFIVLQNRDDDDADRSNRGRDSYSSEYTGDDDDDNDYDDPQDIYDNEDHDNRNEPTEDDVDEQPTTEKQKKTVITPGVLGTDVNQAAQRLREMGFVVNIEEQYSDKPQSTVISQSIEPGTTVDEDTDITIVASLGEDPNQDITVPAVQNKTFEDARNELERAGLVVNSAYEESDTIDRDKVIDQSIPPGTKVRKGTNIILTVSTGRKEPVDTIKHGKVLTKETDLNVRKGPGTEYEIAGTINKDSSVEIVEIIGSWYKIKFQNSYGYVSNEFIQIEN